MSKSEIQAEFFNQGEGHSRDSFQSWLKPICALLHEGADCIDVNPTQGDGGLDFVIPSQGVAYQVYGPDNDPTDAKIAVKINEDLPKAVNTLSNTLQVWRMIINRRAKKLGKNTTKISATLHTKYPNIAISVWHLDRLWDELMLPTEKSTSRLAKLAKILGVTSFAPNSVAEEDKLFDEARALANDGKYQEGFDKGKQALAILKNQALAEPILQALAFLIILGQKLDLGDSLRRYGEELDVWHPQVSNPKALVNYYRAKATLGNLACDLVAERTASLQGMALLEKLDDDFAKFHYCCFCHNLIAIACKEQDLDQAQHWITASIAMLDSYQGEHQDLLLLNLLDARMWRAVLAKNESELEACINLLGQHGKISEIGAQFAEALSNYVGNFYNGKFYKAARQAAVVALNLANKLHMKQDFILSVTYNLAMAKYCCDDIEGAVATLKPLLTLPVSTKNNMLKGAAMHLFSVIQLKEGQFEQSEYRAQKALELIPDLHGQIQIKFHLARSQFGVGKLNDAVEHFHEAWHLAQDLEKFPQETLIELAGCCGIAAAQIGLQEKCDWALRSLTMLEQHDAKLCAEYRTDIGNYSELRQRIAAIGKHTNATLEAVTKQVRRFALYTDLAPKKRSKIKCNTLAETNALTISPLITWWKDTMGKPHEAAIDLDYWGSGGFAQILSNMRAFSSAFNVMLEVRSVLEIRAIAKLWGLYADFILLIWKGAVESVKCLSTVDAEYFGPWGHGYILTLGSEIKMASGRRRCLSINNSTLLPDEVITFMQTEAHDLIAAGKLLIVPASVVGCVSPGWGPMEQGIAEAGNAIPGTRAKFDEVIGLGSLPYSPDLPFPAILEFSDKYESDLFDIRQNLAKRAAIYRQMGSAVTDQRLQRDINDLLKMAEVRQKSDNISKKGRIAKEAIGLGTSPFRNGLRLDAEAGVDKTFEPLLVLKTMGYGWQMGKLDANDQQRPYQANRGEAIGDWLCPAESGTRFLFVKKTDNE